MDGIRLQVERRVGSDQPPIDPLAVRDARKSRPVVAGRSGRDLLDEERPVAFEGRTDPVADRRGQVGGEPIDGCHRPVGPLDPAGIEEGPLDIRASEQVVQLRDDASNESPRRDDTPTQGRARRDDEVVDRRRHRPPPGQQRLGLLRRSNGLERGDVQEGDLGSVERVDRPRRHARRDQVELVAEEVDQGRAGDPQRLGEADGLDRPRPLYEMLEALRFLLEVAGPVGPEPIVEPAIADRGREDRLVRDHDLPRLGCEIRKLHRGVRGERRHGRVGHRPIVAALPTDGHPARAPRPGGRPARRCGVSGCSSRWGRARSARSRAGRPWQPTSA